MHAFVKGNQISHTYTHKLHKKKNKLQLGFYEKPKIKEKQNRIFQLNKKLIV